jgi:hypothetical protein
MLRDSRLASHFEFHGDFSRHFGLFPGCGGSLPFSLAADWAHQPEVGSGCC